MVRLIGIRRTSSIAVLNSGKQCFVVHTKRFSRFSPPRNLKICLLKLSPILARAAYAAFANAPQVEWRRFSGVWVPEPNWHSLHKRVRLCKNACLIVLGGIGIPAGMKVAPA